MDHIYPTRDYKEYYIRDCVKQMQKCGQDMPITFEAIAPKLNITEEEIKAKSLEICKVYEDYGKETTNSSETGELSIFPRESMELNCMKFIKDTKPIFKDDRNKESRLCIKDVLVEDSQELSDINPHEDAVLTIRFYEPFRYAPCIKNHPRLQAEYLVLASNFLTQLRDKISCICNSGPFFDISEFPTAQILSPEDAPNPGFFFIHDTFYNDTRSPNNPNYSDVILNWYKRFNYVREFKTAIMEDTNFEDLTVRIGYPCVYQHHGACEHLFCITSIDLINSSDNLIRAKYPKLLHSTKKRAIKCDTCKVQEPEYMVTNCPLHVKDPTKLCRTCFLLFHYIDQQTKTCEFKAFRIKISDNDDDENNANGAHVDARDYEVIGEYEVENIEHGDDVLM